jgi:hypothetical protein
MSVRRAGPTEESTQIADTQNLSNKNTVSSLYVWEWFSGVIGK